jgi:hypothetical protein
MYFLYTILSITRRTLRSWIWIGARGDEVDDAGVEREHERGGDGYKGAGFLP